MAPIRIRSAAAVGVGASCDGGAELNMLGFKPEHASLADHATCSMSLCGKPMVLDMSGALYWPGEQTLVVADLSLGDAQAGGGRGPDALLRLAETLDRLGPRRVIALGLGVARRKSAAGPGDLRSLAILQEGREWIWIADCEDQPLASGLGGTVLDRLDVGSLVLAHKPTPGSVIQEISGHLRPAACLSIYGTEIRRPCFVGNGRRLVLPAFAALAGGLNILDEAFLPLFGNEGMLVWMLGQEGVYPVAARQLRSD